MESLASDNLTEESTSKASVDKALGTNVFHKKYYSVDKRGAGKWCRPDNKLKKLLRKPYGCRADLESCKAGLPAVKGKLGSEFETLFADMLEFEGTTQKGRPKFLYKCELRNPEHLHYLGIQGLGFTGSRQHLDKLLALGKPEILAELGHAERERLAKAIWRIQDKEKGIEVLETMLGVSGDTKTFKALALQYLHRWDSDAGIQFCQNALKQKDDNRLIGACIRYLGQRGASDSYNLLVRKMKEHEREVIRALGHFDTEKAIRFLEKYLSRTDLEAERARALAALINLGQTQHWDELKLYISGKESPNATKVEEVLRQKASMETIAIEDSGIGSKIDAFLRAESEKTSRENQPAVYPGIALAQRGREAGIKKVIEWLESPRKRVWEPVLTGIGGDDDSPHVSWHNRGTGVIGDERLIAPILKLYEMESGEGKKLRSEMLTAAVDIRAMVRLENK